MTTSASALAAPVGRGNQIAPPAETVDDRAVIGEGQARAATASVLAAVLFGTTGTTAHLVGSRASAESLGLTRLLVGGGLLFLLAPRADRTPASHTARGRATRGWLISLGAIAIVGYQPLFFLGVARNGVAVGTVVALGSAPVITGIADAVRRRKPPSLRWLWTTLVAILGVVLVSGVLAGGGRADPIGVAASVGGGACYAVYAIVAAGLIGDGYGRARTMGLLFGTAALIALPLWLATDRAWLRTWSGAAAALWLGVAATAIAYLLLARGFGALPTPTVATLTLAEPVTATLLGTLVLHEHLTPVSAAGLTLLGFALIVLALPRPSHAVVRRPEPQPR